MPGDSNADAPSIRSAIRWGLLLATIGTFGFRLVPLVRDFRAWRRAVGLGDATEAEGLRTYLIADAISVSIVLALGLALFFLLRPRAKSQA